MDANIKKGLKVAVIFIAALIIIITHAAVWNSASAGVADGFVAGVAVVNFLIEGVALYEAARALLSDNSSEDNE